MLKLADNPPTISSWLPSIGIVPGKWWVGRTRSNAEKMAAWTLEERRVGYFLPMVKHTIFSGGRKRHGMKPLFPSYIFFGGDLDARLTAISSKHICQVIEVPDQKQLLHELMSIERCLKSDTPMDVYPVLAEGDRCRVASGPLMGLEGTLLRCSKPSKLILEVSMLGRGAALEIEIGLLERLESSPSVGRPLRPALQSSNINSYR